MESDPFFITPDFFLYFPNKLCYPPVDLHWFFDISISAFISNWDKNSVIN